MDWDIRADTRMCSCLLPHFSRPAAFDDSPTEAAWTQGDNATETEEPKDEEEEGGEDVGEEESQTTSASSSKGLTMVEDRFAQMHVNRNRRKGHFDDEEEEEDSDDE
ncbi:unnamed protein product [Phytophthora lilii]|uniref:Unnamed protein product n=1 Tax=Phytophthora lilii TaxID=2077276 RepID=A0A9W6WNH5_9STRA|nr:unnamed protein product [Phytophthora lilii]